MDAFLIRKTNKKIVYNKIKIEKTLSNEYCKCVSLTFYKRKVN